MRTPPKLSDLVARRGFLIGAGVAGAGAALGTGLALPGGSGSAVAATAPPRSALMTAALGAPLDDLPEAVREAGK
ncbi:laccase, partial [Streptomyces griseus]